MWMFWFSPRSRAEIARREDVTRRHLFVKILYNDKEVSRTESRPLNTDFRVHFGQIFNLKIINCPQSINLQVQSRNIKCTSTDRWRHALLLLSLSLYVCGCILFVRRCLRRLDRRVPSWLKCSSQCQNPLSWRVAPLLRNLSLAATREWCSTMRELEVVNVCIWLQLGCVTINQTSIVPLQGYLIFQFSHLCQSLFSCLPCSAFASSDVPLSFEADGSNNQTLLTSGKLSCCVSWGIGEDDVPLAPPVSQQPGGVHR